MTAPTKVWLIHDSGAMGAEYVAVELLSVGPTGRFATCRSAAGRTFRTAPGNLVPASEPEWSEDFDHKGCKS